MPRAIPVASTGTPGVRQKILPNFVAIDFETADNGQDSACSVGLVRVEAGKIVAREHYLIRPPRETFLFTDIHGITWADVEKEPTFGELWPTIQKTLTGADFLAAHWAPFDKGVLTACCLAAGVEPPPHPFLCTVKLARAVFDIFPTKLPNVCAALRLELNHHNALSDAEACARIVIKAHSRQARKKASAKFWPN